MSKKAATAANYHIRIIHSASFMPYEQVSTLQNI